MTRIGLFDRINRMNKMSGSPYPILSILFILSKLCSASVQSLPAGRQAW